MEPSEIDEEEFLGYGNEDTGNDSENNKKRSQIWKFFVEITVNGERFSKCVLCKEKDV